MEFWSRFDAIAREHDVLRHRFYVRWSVGGRPPTTQVNTGTPSSRSRRRAPARLPAPTE